MAHPSWQARLPTGRPRRFALADDDRPLRRDGAGLLCRAVGLTDGLHLSHWPANGRRRMTSLAGWIEGAWIHSNDPTLHGKFWIQDDWIWGPVGAEDVTTRYWIKDGWIWNAGGAEAHT